MELLLAACICPLHGPTLTWLLLVLLCSLAGSVWSVLVLKLSLSLIDAGLQANRISLLLSSDSSPLWPAQQPSCPAAQLSPTKKRPCPFRPGPDSSPNLSILYTTRLSSFNLHSPSSSSLLLLPIPSRSHPHLNPREGGPPPRIQLTACYVDDSLVEFLMPACTRSLVSSVRTCQFR